MNVLTKDYQQLEEKIQGLSEKWSKSLENTMLTTSEQRMAIKDLPAIPQLNISFDTELYHRFIRELFTLLGEAQPSLGDQMKKLDTALTEETLEQWLKEAIAVNNFYFEKFASEQDVAEWLPFFAAEHAARPFLQKISSELSEDLYKENRHGSCPACGEPPRIAVLNKKGKKEMTCPRCLFTWEIKKVMCAHCGTDEPGKVEILKVEKDERAEVYVCNDCKGYTKVIDTRKLIRKEPVGLLDIKSIHLDFVAQEKGYGIPEVKNTH